MYTDMFLYIFALNDSFRTSKPSQKTLSSGRNLESQQATLPETNSSHLKNGWLEYDRFLLGLTGLFSVARLVVSGRVLPRYIGIKVSVNQPSWNVIRVWFTLLILLSVNPSPISRFGPCAMPCNVP